jgi:hypothetical protein
MAVLHEVQVEGEKSAHFASQLLEIMVNAPLAQEAHCVVEMQYEPSDGGFEQGLGLESNSTHAAEV